MAKHMLLIAAKGQKSYAEKLTARALPELEIVEEGTAEIFLGEPWLLNSRVANAPNLKWIQTTTVGVDALMDTALRRDYTLTNARGILGPKLTEYAFAHILAYKKRVLELREMQARKEWVSKPAGSLVGETMALLGTGSIGANIARVAKAFGMHTCGYRTKKEPVEHFDETFGQDELAEALSKGDYVVCVLPSTKETDSVIRAETIAHMKDGVVFMNIGRGNTVVEEDVLAAVRSGKIARAILDVFQEEPLSQTSELWGEKNVIVTPHMAGYADEDAVLDLFAENYRRFREGKTLQHVVDFDKGY